MMQGGDEIDDRFGCTCPSPIAEKVKKSHSFVLRFPDCKEEKPVWISIRPNMEQNPMPPRVLYFRRRQKRHVLPTAAYC
jgi:hypothetical protein